MNNMSKKEFMGNYEQVFTIELTEEQQRIKELQEEVLYFKFLINRQAAETRKLKDRLNKIRELTKP